MREQRFCDDKALFYRNVFALVLPMALQNLINVGITSADVIMLGKVGEIALSSSSLAGQIYFIMSLILFGLTSGAAVITAQYWGKKDIETIEKVLGISMRVGLSVGILFFAAAQLMPTALMRIFTSEQAIIEEGVKYLRIVSWSYPLAAAAVVYLNIMRSVERVIISTLVYSASLVVNVIFNAIFIFGLGPAPAMGVSGAGLRHGDRPCGRVRDRFNIHFKGTSGGAFPALVYICPRKGIDEGFQNLCASGHFE